jgi:hypothetical protein
VSVWRAAERAGEAVCASLVLLGELLVAHRRDRDAADGRLTGRLLTGGANLPPNLQD